MVAVIGAVVFFVQRAITVERSVDAIAGGYLDLRLVGLVICNQDGFVELLSRFTVCPVKGSVANWVGRPQRGHFSPWGLAA